MARKAKAKKVFYTPGTVFIEDSTPTDWRVTIHDTGVPSESGRVFKGYDEATARQQFSDTCAALKTTGAHVYLLRPERVGFCVQAAYYGM